MKNNFGNLKVSLIVLMISGASQKVKNKLPINPMLFIPQRYE